MNEWASYRLQDFIPFTADVYFRLLEGMGEAFWPLQFLTVAVGGAAFLCALNNRSRFAWLLVTPLWVFVGVAFFLQRYAELNWAASYMGKAFFAQAALLALVPLIGGRNGERQFGKSTPVVAGMAITLFGLLGLPLIAPLSGGSWYRAEVFGIHPDPTAIVTLGLVLIALRGMAMWVLAIIPMFWVLFSSLTLFVLDAPKAAPLIAVLATGIFGLVWSSVASRAPSKP